MRMTGIGALPDRTPRAVNGGSIYVRAGSAQPLRLPAATSGQATSVVQPVPQISTTSVTPIPVNPAGGIQARLSPGQTPPATIRVSPTASVVSAGGGVGVATGGAIMGSEVPVEKPKSVLPWLALLSLVLFGT